MLMLLLNSDVLLIFKILSEHNTVWIQIMPGSSMGLDLDLNSLRSKRQKLLRANIADPDQHLSLLISRVLIPHVLNTCRFQKRIYCWMGMGVNLMNFNS